MFNFTTLKSFINEQDSPVVSAFRVVGILSKIGLKLFLVCSPTAFIFRPSQGIFSLVGKVIAQQLLLILQQLTFQSYAIDLVASNLLEVQMAESGKAEKFPDEWDLQLLGSTIIGELSSGVPLDFLIQRYLFLIPFPFTGSNLVLEF